MRPALLEKAGERVGVTPLERLTNKLNEELWINGLLLLHDR